MWLLLLSQVWQVSFASETKREGNSTETIVARQSYKTESLSSKIPPSLSLNPIKKGQKEKSNHMDLSVPYLHISNFCHCDQIQNAVSSCCPLLLRLLLCFLSQFVALCQLQKCEHQNQPITNTVVK